MTSRDSPVVVSFLQRFPPFMFLRADERPGCIPHYDDNDQLRAKLEARTKAVTDWKNVAVANAAKSERDYLLKMKSDAALAQESIAKFVVEKSRFYFSEGRFSSDPVIDMMVRNNTGQTVSRLYARGVLSSPGRETPWVDKEFNYSIRGGMQSGEAQNLELAPNRFTEWGKAPKDKSDMVLAVTIKRLDGADGKKLFEAEFSEKSAARLAVLEKIIQSQSGKLETSYTPSERRILNPVEQ